MGWREDEVQRQERLVAAQGPALFGRPCFAAGFGGSYDDRPSTHAALPIRGGNNLVPVCRWHAAAITRSGYAVYRLPVPKRG
jgi:hypothetical protein